MIKLICKRCGQTWYTANTKPNQKCGECGGDLIEEDLINSNDTNTDKENSCKIIYLK